MVVFELAVLLAFVSIAAFPCWRYSADWGYLPSAVSGVLLLAVMAVAVTDKGPDRLARHGVAPPTVRVAAAPTTDANRRRNVEPVTVVQPISQ
jgi:Protein of unknown function (DUF3309)